MFADVSRSGKVYRHKAVAPLPFFRYRKRRLIRCLQLRMKQIQKEINEEEIFAFGTEARLDREKNSLRELQLPT